MGRDALNFEVDLRGFAKGMADVHKKQIPFAVAQALTATGGHVGVAWQDEMRKQLDRPTPFTINSISVKRARKSDPTATVFVRPVAAQYLEPFVDGGLHFLGNKRGMLTPKAIALNNYGNLPKNKIAQLLADPSVFVGPVKLRNGQTVNGVWQRGDRGQRRGKTALDRLMNRGGKYGTKGSHNVKHNKAMGITSLTTLKLLIRFNDPMPVTQHLDFEGRATAAVLKHFTPEFEKAFAKAKASAN